MADTAVPDAILGSEPPHGAALQHRHWRMTPRLSSVPGRLEDALDRMGASRAPWLAVAVAAGIAIWFGLPAKSDWLATLALLAGLVCAGAGLPAERYPRLRQAVISVALAVALGLIAPWAKSSMTGTLPIGRATIAQVDGRVLSLEDDPAQDRARIVVATRLGDGRAVKVRINLPREALAGGIDEGARVRLRARLAPPAAPLVPGAYDFARAAWFAGLAATGSALGPVTVTEPAEGRELAHLQHAIARHVESRVAGSAGGIAAAFASGERGGIAKADEEAMRDAGLTHLLSISGLHVSAVVAAAYLVALRLLALWPWLALRVRLPILAAGVGAGAGVGYTLLTGAEVPTVRSCLGALLVLAALAAGREPLSLRLLALAATLVMIAWPEAVAGPSFQMSFAAVLAIMALHGAVPIASFAARREEALRARLPRALGVLLITGLVIELALMPIGLFHFHRAGAYGALANVIAIPLTTFVSMPLIALALLLDSIGLGGPVWWLAGLSLDGLLALARWVAARPGAVTMLPAMGAGHFAFFVAGGLWLALQRGPARLWGLAPMLVGAAGLALLRPPGIMIGRDGRHVAVVGDDGRLRVIGGSSGGYGRDALAEAAGFQAGAAVGDDPSGDNRSGCGSDFCAIRTVSDSRAWTILVARSDYAVPLADLQRACAAADVVIADRTLPGACRPRWLKADRALLGRTGGISIDLRRRRVSTVADDQGAHPWWRARGDQ
ncbi:ComEC/Rec2 family competence protein [Parablastomonas sp. CN1-191]|uniref:ComEC/Rec2 family competence protein n=1 Tax=Parablastomonas sp. CN1-191 TaxID=3400908 RepID=UPI003BF88858